MSPQASIGHYRILSKLGQGGMGEVWRATDTKLGREVAIKVLPEGVAGDPDRLARFQREAQLLAALNHSNIATIYGVEDRALVLELVDGPTLAERIAEGPIPLDEALAIARQIGDALEAAHERGVVHRDLKPANIKLTGDGRVKVLDFGLAKAMAGDLVSGDTANSPTLTMQATLAGVILGTAGYMAPEQAKGKSVDKRADIWAFGVVLYEMLTGSRLFVGETVSDTLAAVLTKDPDVERVPARVRKLLRSCLEKDPKQRLRDIGDGWRLLEDSPPPASPKRGATLPWVVAAVVLGVIAAALAVVHFRETPAPAPLTRFSILPPENGLFGDWISLSPDGRQLAYMGSGADGVLHIWIRSLDSLQPRAVAVGEAATTITLFWSPDSRSLAFESGGKLKKVDVGGGPAQTICDSPPVLLGGSWRSDGTILFGGNQGPIVRVSAAGGTASPVTRLEPSRNESFHTDPSFLPDGVHFLYFRHSDPEKQGVYVGSLDAKPEDQSLAMVVRTDFSPAYAPPRGGRPGYLLYVRDGALLAQQFDLRRMSMTGEPVLLADQIGTNITRALFSVSANGVLAYRGGYEHSGDLMWLDRAGHSLGPASQGGDFRNMAISPDGARFAYDRTTQDTLRQVWMEDVARRVPSRLTFMPTGASSPVWSPDGREVAFLDLGRRGVYAKGANDGREARQLAAITGLSLLDDWSADGRYLLYSVAAKGYDLMVLPIFPGSDGKPVAVADSPAFEAHGQVSPDSRWVAYDSNESGKLEVYVRAFPPGAGRTQKFQVTSNGGQQPRWRGDGKELYFLGLDHAMMAVDVKTQPEFEFGSPHALFPATAVAVGGVQFQYDVTRDGKKFLMLLPSSGASSAPINVALNWDAALH